MSNLTRKLLAGSAWAFLLRVLTAISALIINSLIARVMAPQEVGVYFLVVSMVTMLTFLGSFGLHMAVVKLIAEALAKGLPGRAKQAVAKVLILGVASCFFVSLVIARGGLSKINSWFYQSSLLEQSACIVSLWIFFWAMQMNIAEIFRGFNDIKLAVAFRRLIPNLFFISILGILYMLGTSLGYRFVLMAGLGAWILSTFLSMMIVIKKVQPLSSEGQVSWGEVINLSWPLGITIFFSMGLMQADVWIIGALGQFDEVAVYGAASRLVNFVVFPLLIVNATMPPVISRLYSQGRMQELERVLRGAATVTTLIGLIFLGGALLFGKSVLEVIYGEFYGTGVLVFCILMFGLLFRFVGGASSFALMMTGQEKTTMWISFSATAMMVCGAIVIGGIYGSAGVACSVAVSSIFQNLAYLYFVKKKIGIHSIPKLDYSAVKAIVHATKGR